MARSIFLSFSNLTCLFGDVLVLADLLDEAVIPAFLNEDLQRRHGVSTYFFRNVGLADIAVEGTEERQLTVYGRLIKNTLLLRTQVYSPSDGLISDEGSMESAPSSFFALDLNNHKLMFLPETPFAPTLGNFATTLESFIRRELEGYIRAQHVAYKASGEPKGYRELREMYPSPEVTVTPLASAGTVSDFIDTFSTLERVEFRLLSTNAEVPQGNNFARIRGMKDGVEATTTRLIHESKRGLNKKVVTAEAVEAAESGNQKVLLRGFGDDGAVLRGSNEDLKLQLAIINSPDTLFEKALLAVRAYASQILSGRLRPDTSRPPTVKLNALRERLDERIERG